MRWCILCLTALLFGEAAWAEGSLQVWLVDPLEKVFRDAQPGNGGRVIAEVARGESATLQAVVRAGKPVTGLRAELAMMTRRWGHETLPSGTTRFVGYVPVDRPTQNPSKDQLRVPPAEYPDPLLEEDAIDVPANQAQPIWITIPIPEESMPGFYIGKLTITGMAGEQTVSVTQRIKVRVYKAVAGRSRLWVTDWFAMHWPHMRISPQPESDEYYLLLRRYARNLAEHRHTVALISPIGLLNVSVDENGKFVFDFSRFDRWVQIFQEEGVIGRIEGGHIGGRKAGWESEFAVTVWLVKDGKAENASVDPKSQEAEAFYAQFFPALAAHLKEKGWLDIYMQHLADEPIASNVNSYRAMAELARAHAPELRIIEACHTKDITGAIDIWVPQLNYLRDSFSHYQVRQQKGEEVWFYTCVFPQGEYANRFIELPLIKTRLLHWINFRYGVTGYLHWGYNHWTAQSPFTHTTRPHGGPPYLPAGDAWIVYPGKEGPLDSIRFEAMRDGIADYELLCMLKGKDPGAAQRLAEKHILNFNRYDTGIKNFRATRRELLRLLSR